MKTILLTQGKVALVDDADFEALSRYKWCARFNRGLWYAYRSSYPDNRKCGHIYMHRQITGFAEADHINHDGLDNRRANLRSATRSQQMGNTRLKPNKAGFRGVRRRNLRFTAQITINYKAQHLGSHSTAEKAARAYDDAANRFFCDFATLNFPKGGQS
jgi:hypothetical protein